MATTWADKAGAKARYNRVHEMTAKRGKEIRVTDPVSNQAVAEGTSI